MKKRFSSGGKPILVFSFGTYIIKTLTLKDLKTCGNSGLQLEKNFQTLAFDKNIFSFFPLLLLLPRLYFSFSLLPASILFFFMNPSYRFSVIRIRPTFD